MTKKEIKQKSLEEINKAIVILKCKKEKITNKRISEVSGLSEITVKRYRSVSDKKKKVSHKPQKVSDKIEKVSDDLPKKVQPVSDGFKHFLRRRYEIA